ncbi:MAG: hypothetical protein AB7F96_15485 [Beijerinckiaceae bacterium]
MTNFTSPTHIAHRMLGETVEDLKDMKIGPEAILNALCAIVGEMTASYFPKREGRPKRFRKNDELIRQNARISDLVTSQLPLARERGYFEIDGQRVALNVVPDGTQTGAVEIEGDPLAPKPRDIGGQS